MEENIIDWWQKLNHNWKKTFLFNLDFNGIDYGTTVFFPDLYNTYYKKFGTGIRKRLDDFQPTEDNILRILNLERLMIRHPETRNINTLNLFKNIKSLSIVDSDIVDLKDLICPNLENLYLGDQKLCSLEGIDDFNELKTLKLTYCNKLENLDHIFKCKNIEMIDLKFFVRLDVARAFINSFYNKSIDKNSPFYKKELKKMVVLPFLL